MNQHLRQGIGLAIMAALIPLLVFGASAAKPVQTPSFESSSDPELSHPPIPGAQTGAFKLGPATHKPKSAKTATSPVSLATPSASDLGPNLINNPSVETAGSGGVPAGWKKGGYGVNTRVFTYPATPASDGASAVSIAVSGYASGDAKWFFDDVPVTAGNTYEFSDAYQSSVPSILTARFLMSDGSFIYTDLGSLSASAAYQRAAVRFAPPAGAVSMTVFHLIKANGTLMTDDASLNQVTVAPPPPPPPGNFVPNGDFEAVGGNGLPVGWGKGGWGSNTRTFAYPVTTIDGSRAAQVSVSAYASGDAKWFFTPVALPADAYTYSDDFQSSVQSFVTVQLHNANGTFSYIDIASLPPQASPTNVTADFLVPPGTQDVTVFHLIKGNGTLAIDNVSIRKTQSSGIFQTGGVVLRFDDGWRSQYDNVRPKLAAANLKGTFYIVTHQLADDGFSGYMSVAEVKNLAAAGHEIAAHTRTHPHLTSLTPAQQTAEIAGSRQDLLGWNVGPVTTFAYPFGEYNATTIQIVKDAGFSGAAATIGGDVTLASDRYQLERRGVENTTSLATVQQWIQNATANDVVLILSFHQVVPGSCTDRYCTTTTTFNGIVDYITQQHVPVATVAQVAAALQ